MIIRLYHIASAISRAGGYLSAAVLVMITGLIALEVVLRNVFATSTFVLGEFVGYGVATMTFLAAGHALAEGDLIRVQLLLGRFSRRARHAAELLCVVLALVPIVFLGWFFCRSVQRQWRTGAVSSTIAEVPLWMPQAIILIGLAVLVLQLVAHGLLVLADPDRAISSPARANE